MTHDWVDRNTVFRRPGLRYVILIQNIPVVVSTHPLPPLVPNLSFDQTPFKKVSNLDIITFVY